MTPTSTPVSRGGFGPLTLCSFSPPRDVAFYSSPTVYCLHIWTSEEPLHRVLDPDFSLSSPCSPGKGTPCSCHVHPPGRARHHLAVLSYVIHGPCLYNRSTHPAPTPLSQALLRFTDSSIRSGTSRNGQYDSTTLTESTTLGTFPLQEGAEGLPRLRKLQEEI